jgi:cysteine desulfurase
MMVYLDYAATTPVDDTVLANYVKSCREYPGNANSSHSLGESAKRVIDDTSQRILSQFQRDSYEVIYTSGATEANNLAILGAMGAKGHPKKHLITTGYEHSSVIACFSWLAKNGHDIDIVESDRYGRVDRYDLAKKIRPDTQLISIGAVSGEIGIIQDIQEIGEMLQAYPEIIFHADLSQAVGKIDLQMSRVDLATFSGHKIYGLKGIGALLRRKEVALAPILYGGKSVTALRPGTPPVPLIISLADALDRVNQASQKKHLQVVDIQQYLRKSLRDIPGVCWNSHEFCVPEINNISVLGHSAKDLQKALSDKEIYVSTQSACSSDASLSAQILRLTQSEKRASSSLRISLSPLTSTAELDCFIQALKEALSC